MPIVPKNWATFQHYKNRSPAWIKLHRGLLDDFEFHRLPLASRALAPMLWLLASEYDDGKIDATIEELAYRLRTSASELSDALKPLLDSGFFISDSATLAGCKQSACLEKEGENKNRREDIGRSKPTRPIDESFEKFKKAYPKREGPNPWKPAFSLWKQAITAGNDAEWICAGAAAYAAECSRLKIEPRMVAQAQTWLRQARWEDYAEAAVAQASVPAKIFIPDTDERYLAHLKASGKRSFPNVNGGWYFDTDWPPGHEKAA